MKKNVLVLLFLFLLYLFSTGTQGNNFALNINFSTKL